MKVRFTFASMEEEIIRETPVFFEKTNGWFCYEWNSPFFPRKGDFIDWQHTIPEEIYNVLPMKEQMYIDGITQNTFIENLSWELEHNKVGCVTMALKACE